MSKYNEQHATTMLNALIGTDTLAEHDKQIRADEKEKIINILLHECGGSAYESDCELCTFAIFIDNVRVGCKLMKQLKEQK